MTSPTTPDAPSNAGCASLKSWSRAPHFPHDYEARTDLPLPPPPHPAAETTATSVAYLACLRAAVAEHRDRINEELTGRMEEDKKREAAAAEGEEQNGAAAGPPAKGKNNKRKAAAADVDLEALEEENYGEEVVEED